MGIEYRLSVADGTCHRFVVDPEACPGKTPSNQPEWTALGFHQCTNCPLAADEHPTCPLATGLVDLVRLCKDLTSFDEMEIEVMTDERTITKQTTVQRGVASLMGLVIATSGCPHTALFRPMARFHLPLSSEEETIYRATSMYLLAQFFARQRGMEADLDLSGLTQAYREMHVVNLHIAHRLRAVVAKDSSVNALVLLDLFSKALPATIEDSLTEIRHLFEPYLEVLEARAAIPPACSAASG